MSKKEIDWSNIGFGYVQTDKRYVPNIYGRIYNVAPEPYGGT